MSECVTLFRAVRLCHKGFSEISVFSIDKNETGCRRFNPPLSVFSIPEFAVRGRDEVKLRRGENPAPRSLDIHTHLAMQIFQLNIMHFS